MSTWQIWHMVREIYLEKIYDFPKGELGRYPTEDDFDEVLDEDVNVYVNGVLEIVFRKKAVKTLLDYTPGTKGFEYWEWASKSLCSDQRGNASGREIVSNKHIRFTEGQLEFFRQAKKGNVQTLEEAQAIIDADKRASRQTYYWHKVKDAGFVDVEEHDRWEKILKKASSVEEQQEALAQRDAHRLVWFQNWLEREWAPAEDKAAAAKLGDKIYNCNQPRGNRSYSAVLGTITRSSRTPYARLTKATLERWDDFVAEQHLYHEIDSLVKEYMPERWKILHDRFQQVKDPKYNLFGTSFTSITVNSGFQVACHADGTNAKDALAALTALDIGEFNGFYFVMHPMRLAFNLRTADLFLGNNQSMVHSITPMEPLTPDANSITYVFYQKDAIIAIDDLECEECRRQFMLWSKDNLKHLGTGEKGWGGSFPFCWSSPYWEEFKAERGMERCRNTNYWGRPDDNWPGDAAVIALREEK